MRDAFTSAGLFRAYFITDGTAFLLYCFPLSFFKLFDTVVYGIMLMIVWKVFTDGSIRMLIASAIGIILFPVLTYLNSAGYIATTTNYIYPVIALFLAVMPLIYEIKQKTVIKAFYLLSVLGILYAANQDQTALVAIGVFLLTGIEYFWLWKQHNEDSDKRVMIVCVRYFVLAVAAYLLMLITLGHINRMNSTVEIEYWLPQYAYWGLGYKLYRGMATTVANLFFLQPALFIFFCLLLFVAVYLFNRRMAVIPAIMVGLLAFCRAIGEEFFVRYYDYSCAMPDLPSIRETPLPFAMSLTILVLLILSVLALVKANERLCFEVIIINILGFGSRIMMGLSATIYASSFRTFTVQLFCFLICSLLLLGEILKKTDSCGL